MDAFCCCSLKGRLAWELSMDDPEVLLTLLPPPPPLKCCATLDCFVAEAESLYVALTALVHMCVYMNV